MEREKKKERKKEREEEWEVEEEKVVEEGEFNTSSIVFLLFFSLITSLQHKSNSNSFLDNTSGVLFLVFFSHI